MLIKVLDRKSLGMDISLEKVEKIGEVEIFDNSTREELCIRIKDADVVIINKLKLDKYILDHAERLKLICVFATGYDNVDVKACKERGIALCNVPGYSTDSVALMTAASLLSLYTNLQIYDRYVKDGSYTRSGMPNRLEPTFHELKGKTWGIVGYGNIGKAVAKIATAFGCNVVYTRKNLSFDNNAVDIDTLCKVSDVITLHCPLNDMTYGIINEKRISLMKKGCIIVNEARGAVVDSVAVVNAILSGHLGGFASDVYESEPFDSLHPFNKILNLNNVILTPHIAWGAHESRMRCLDIICDNINAYREGKILNRVDI